MASTCLQCPAILLFFFIFYYYPFIPKGLFLLCTQLNFQKNCCHFSCTLSLKCTRVNPSCLQTWKSNLQPHDGQLNRSENAADTDAFLHMGGGGGGGGREGHLAGDVMTSLEEVLGDYSDPLRHEGQSLWIDR